MPLIFLNPKHYSHYFYNNCSRHKYSSKHIETQKWSKNTNWKHVTWKEIELYLKIFIQKHNIAVFSDREHCLEFHQQIDNIRKKITGWYYEGEGELLMSISCQIAYMDFQNVSRNMLKHKQNLEIEREKDKTMGYILRLELLKM